MPGKEINAFVAHKVPVLCTKPGLNASIRVEISTTLIKQ